MKQFRWKKIWLLLMVEHHTSNLPVKLYQNLQYMYYIHGKDGNSSAHNMKNTPKTKQHYVCTSDTSKSFPKIFLIHKTAKVMYLKYKKCLFPFLSDWNFNAVSCIEHIFNALISTSQSKQPHLFKLFTYPLPASYTRLPTISVRSSITLDCCLVWGKHAFPHKRYNAHHFQRAGWSQSPHKNLHKDSLSFYVYTTPPATINLVLCGH